MSRPPTAEPEREPEPEPEPVVSSADRTLSPRAQRSYLIACGALIGACLAYWLPHWASLPMLLYIPLERRWTFTPPLDTPAITYFGLLLWGAAGLVTGALGSAALTALPPLRRPLSTPSLRVVGAWALTAFVLTGWYYTWNLWPF